VRLFVAFDFPDSVRRSLGDLIAKLRPQASHGKWVRLESMHITLKFIGEAPREGLDSIRAALSAIRSTSPAEMHFRGLGFFPHERKPRVLWCGVETSPNIAALAADIDRVLEPLGIARETREFVPHLTLARFENPAGLEKLVSAAESLESTDFGGSSEREFCLYESFLQRSGAEYTRLAAFPFVAPDSPGPSASQPKEHKEPQ
jgi:RNA 2',3'-cyclic 3'-phosphodiesterase